MAEVKILDVRKLPSLAPERQGKLDRIVIYQGEGNAAGLVRIPDETFSDDALKRAIQADLKERQALVGKTLTL